jgi:hypothetical protein
LAFFVTPTLGALFESVPIPGRATSLSRTMFAGASHAIGSVAWPLNSSWNVPPVTLRRLTIRWCAVGLVMSMCATTSVGWNGASVIAFRLTLASSESSPPVQNESS